MDKKITIIHGDEGNMSDATITPGGKYRVTGYTRRRFSGDDTAPSITIDNKRVDIKTLPNCPLLTLTGVLVYRKFDETFDTEDDMVKFFAEEPPLIEKKEENDGS